MENLLKCDGRRFRAKIEGVECEGKIQVDGNFIYLCQDQKFGYKCNQKYGYKYSWRLEVVDGFDEIYDDESFPCWLEGFGVTDFQLLGMTAAEIEAYKDWQVGDKVSLPGVDGPDVMEVIFRVGKMVACEDKNEAAYVYTCNELYDEGWRLVADPEPEDDTVELTLDQIAEKFGIEPGKLRIKNEYPKSFADPKRFYIFALNKRVADRKLKTYLCK